MTDRNKFEEMLERLINEDRDGAEELFHEIVVEKSREIYQSIVESEDEDLDEADDEEVDESEDEDLDEATDEEVEESDDEDLDESEDEDLDEMFGLDEFEVEADPMDMGGDATDDMMGDLGMGDEEGEEGEEGEEEIEDRVMDLEDALDALKAEFDAMMGDEEGEDHGMDGDEEGEEGGDEEGEEEPEEESYAFEADEEEEVEETRQPKSASEQMREYVEKVSPAKMGDNGANSKSTVAGKNDMGGTSANIAKSATEAGVEANKGNLKGSALSDQNAKEDSAGNVNVPGGKASKSMKAQPKGHGAEKKGAGETADNKKSTVGK